MLKSVMSFFAATMFALAPPLAPASAEGADPVLVTVTGAVGKTNRGPFDEKTDVFLKHHEASFEKAYAFTRSELMALGAEDITLAYGEEWEGEKTFRGPRVADILKAVEAEGQTVTFQALDGYGLELDRKMLEAGAFILALEADGKALGIGDFGPAWLVYPPQDWTHESIAANSGLIWSVFHIKVD